MLPCSVRWLLVTLHPRQALAHEIRDCIQKWRRAAKQRVFVAWADFSSHVVEVVAAMVQLRLNRSSRMQVIVLSKEQKKRAETAPSQARLGRGGATHELTNSRTHERMQPHTRMLLRTCVCRCIGSCAFGAQQKGFACKPLHTNFFFVCKVGPFYSSTQGWRLRGRHGAAAAGSAPVRRKLQSRQRVGLHGPGPCIPTGPHPLWPCCASSPCPVPMVL